MILDQSKSLIYPHFLILSALKGRVVLIFEWCLFSKLGEFSGAYFREWCLFSSGLIFEILRYIKRMGVAKIFKNL